MKNLNASSAPIRNNLTLLASMNLVLFITAVSRIADAFADEKQAERGYPGVATLVTTILLMSAFCVAAVKAVDTYLSAHQSKDDLAQFMLKNKATERTGLSTGATNVIDRYLTEHPDVNRQLHKMNKKSVLLLSDFRAQPEAQQYDAIRAANKVLKHECFRQQFISFSLGILAGVTLGMQMPGVVPDQDNAHTFQKMCLALFVLGAVTDVVYSALWYRRENRRAPQLNIFQGQEMRSVVSTNVAYQQAPQCSA